VFFLYTLTLLYTVYNFIDFNKMEPLPVHRSVEVEAMQLRLLQLRHASKCLIEKNCPISKTCAIMKELWRHILICRHNDCNRNHCLSSRQVLSHYSKCNFFGCLLCVPVREAIYLQNQKNLERMATTSQSNLNISIQSKSVFGHTKRTPDLY